MLDSNSEVSFQKIKSEAYEIIDFEIQLSNLLEMNDQLTLDYKNYEKFVTIKQLQKISDHFDTTNKVGL